MAERIIKGTVKCPGEENDVDYRVCMSCDHKTGIAVNQKGVCIICEEKEERSAEGN